MLPFLEEVEVVVVVVQADLEGRVEVELGEAVDGRPEGEGSIMLVQWLSKAWVIIGEEEEEAVIMTAVAEGGVSFVPFRRSMRLCLEAAISARKTWWQPQRFRVAERQ